MLYQIQATFAQSEILEKSKILLHPKKGEDVTITRMVPILPS